MRFFMDVNPVADSEDAGSSADSIARVAAALEAAGFDGIGFTDHPAPSAKWLAGGGHATLDPFAALAFCAAATSTISLLSHLLVVPYRNPLLQTTSIASVDFLSKGRSIFVLGAGYLRSEFAALGVDFERRNELFDEYVDVIQAYSTGKEMAREGTGYRAIGQRRTPVAVQRPHPPFWLGGNSSRTRDRVAKWADGWSVLMGSPTLAATSRTASISTLDELRIGIEDVWRRADSYGRDASLITIQASSEVLALNDAVSPGQQLEEISRLAEIGVTWVHVPMGHWGTEETLDRIASFGADVIAPSR